MLIKPCPPHFRLLNKFVCLILSHGELHLNVSQERAKCIWGSCHKRKAGGLRWANESRKNNPVAEITFDEMTVMRFLQGAVCGLGLVFTASTVSRRVPGTHSRHRGSQSPPPSNQFQGSCPVLWPTGRATYLLIVFAQLGAGHGAVVIHS